MRAAALRAFCGMAKSLTACGQVFMLTVCWANLHAYPVQILPSFSPLKMKPDFQQSGWVSPCIKCVQRYIQQPLSEVLGGSGKSVIYRKLGMGWLGGGG